MTHDKERFLTDMLKHRDMLLQSAQAFLGSLGADDVESLTPRQRDLLKDLALFAGCTHLSWWNATIEDPEG